VMALYLANPESNPVTLTNITLTASGSGNDQTGIDTVRLYTDINMDCNVDGGDTLNAMAAYSADNGTASIPLAQIMPAASDLNFLVLYEFSASAPAGTYQAGVNVGGISGDTLSGPVSVANLPLSGAVITIGGATPTTTAIPTETETPTDTPTEAPTVTGMAASGSVVSLGTHATATITPTPMPSLDLSSQPVLYPNPSTGSEPVRLHVPGLTGASDVRVQIFSLSYRLVREQFYPQVAPGSDVAIDLVDKTGVPLANGTYYIVVTAQQTQSVVKLLILR
jgi:hypothetical protein